MDNAGDISGPYAGSFTVGGSGTISNSQCSISASGTTATTSGTNLTLTLNITFLSAFFGQKTLYNFVKTSTGGGSSSGWHAMGGWTVPGTAAQTETLTETSFTPFGEKYLTYGSGTIDTFAGLLGIADAGSIPDGYQATARLYESNAGRWLSPDPAGLAAVDLTNPQSWNMYAYVLNNPLMYVDPNGLDGQPLIICYWDTVSYTISGAYNVATTRRCIVWNPSSNSSSGVGPPPSSQSGGAGLSAPTTGGGSGGSGTNNCSPSPASQSPSWLTAAGMLRIPGMAPSANPAVWAAKQAASQAGKYVGPTNAPYPFEQVGPLKNQPTMDNIGRTWTSEVWEPLSKFAEAIMDGSGGLGMLLPIVLSPVCRVDRQLRPPPAPGPPS